MKAVYVRQFGGAGQMEVREVDDPPPPKGEEVLVRVRAAALNRADILQRKGLYPPPPGYPERIPGLEFAGEIVETGEDARAFETGTRVFGITSGGGQAENLVTREDQLARIPRNMDFVSAAAVPEAFITAHDAIFTQARLKPGESILIHAVGSGVGLAAVQLAKAADAYTIGSSRTPAKLEACGEFGLDTAISTADGPEFAGAVLEATNGTGADMVLDLVGAAFFESNLKSLAVKGRMMLVGLVAGAVADFDMRLVLRKRLTLTGTVLRARSDKEKADVTSAFSKEVLPLFKSGKIIPNLDRVFPAEEIEKAHEYLESNANFGKVVLEF